MSDVHLLESFSEGCWHDYLLTEGPGVTMGCQKRTLKIQLDGDLGQLV